ncbi:MAG: 50S ribosomal protein L6 [Candidatus Tagabacteria bacterium RIFCSPLOWO2_01_FULL_39_11]|uniref:Large ribosomal subunit protein uL6 n=1 Tax=Candidatus Tagabacteria bacterium RIFCSPLOWO2_01_FULL_39_11 TaxID=1802295 RepID=A0A1G2LRT7_9BACT|nr:MAG: 50S ribosomal protein L6 [Candidatus Tagabacteria bacterium RIFCSPLOWO2_01_FULL_39_11]
MSRLAKKPISIPEGIKAEIENGTISIKGPKGELSRSFKNDYIDIAKEGSLISFKNLAVKNIKAKALLGTYAAHIRNMIKGVSEGFEKKLIIEGIGYKCRLEGENLILNLGFSHPVKYEAPKGVDLRVEKNFIFIKGIDKELVGRTAAQIRDFKKPEPYKGKGIRYEGEVVRRKAGKRAAGAA